MVMTRNVDSIDGYHDVSRDSARSTIGNTYVLRYGLVEHLLPVLAGSLNLPVPPVALLQLQSYSFSFSPLGEDSRSKLLC